MNYYPMALAIFIAILEPAKLLFVSARRSPFTLSKTR